MAAALVDSIRRPERHRAMAENGRAVVRERYDWNGLADKLEQVWEACADCLAASPASAPLTPALAGLAAKQSTTDN
jgi:hypothetical protein